MSDHLCLIEFFTNPPDDTALPHAETVDLAFCGMGVPD